MLLRIQIELNCWQTEDSPALCPVPKNCPNFDRHSSDEKHPGAWSPATSVSKGFSPSPSVSTKYLFGLFCTTRKGDLLTQNVFFLMYTFIQSLIFMLRSILEHWYFLLIDFPNGPSMRTAARMRMGLVMARLHHHWPMPRALFMFMF